MKLLLIWQEIPENTVVYKFDSGTKYEYDLLVACHNHIFGLALASPPAIDSKFDEVSQLLEKKAEFKILDASENDGVIGEGIELETGWVVVISGYVM